MTERVSQTANRIALASTSPRRRELLEGLGLDVTLVTGDIDETRAAGEPVRDYVRRLAAGKAAQGRLDRRADQLTLVAGDTVVALGDTVFGKPADADDAIRMLCALSDREHSVHSAVAVDDGSVCRVQLVSSTVTFMPISRAMAQAYWETGEPADKAGAYGIQGKGGRFVAHLAGSFSAVMGLPVFETANMLAAAGLTLFDTPGRE
ncbi:MAG: Maf family protein [Pseudomonadota bacterium]